jgi:CelD/BcsL family acetyltransferase involved in cellulose biosynthesis
LRIVQYGEIPEDPELHRQWNEVAQKMERPEVFYTCEWALAVQGAYRASLKPLLFLGYEGDELVGVASLATNKADENTVFLAASTADYCDFLTQPSSRPEFLDAVLSALEKSKAASVTLANLPEDSATTTALPTAAKKHGFHLHARPAYVCAQVDLCAGNERQELKAMLAGKKKLRQYLRGMEREGPVTFAHLQVPAEIQAALPAFADAHVARFQATRRVSSLSTPERRLFLQELVRRFEDTGVVTLSMLMVRGRPVAWNYGFQFQGSWFWYQPTFDSSQELNSPGYCLLSRIVIEACDMERMQTVDLGLGAEGYKERFGNRTRQTLYVTMTRSWPRHLAEIARYRAANGLKKFPKLESTVRRVLGR